LQIQFKNNRNLCYHLKSTLYSYGFKTRKTYLYAVLFVVGNIVFPQLAHLFPNGGLILLPIYFFTLIAAYKYGFAMGLLTAALSPLINYLLFGMPPLPMLPIIWIKSALLVLAAALSAHYFKKVNLAILLLVILSYQFVGTLIEWIMVKDFYIAIQDFRLGMPGMLIQLFGAWWIIGRAGRTGRTKSAKDDY